MAWSSLFCIFFHRHLTPAPAFHWRNGAIRVFDRATASGATRMVICMSCAGTLGTGPACREARTLAQVIDASDFELPEKLHPIYSLFIRSADPLYDRALSTAPRLDQVYFTTTIGEARFIRRAHFFPPPLICCLLKALCSLFFASRT